MAGQREEHVVEVGGVDGERRASTRAVARGGPSPRGSSRSRRRSGRRASAPRRRGSRRRARPPRRRAACVVELEVDAAAGHEPLELGRACRRPRSRPWSSTAIRSASWSASSRYWVVSRIVVPSATSSRTMAHISARLRGSRPGRRLVEEDDRAAARRASSRGRAGAACRPSRSRAACVRRPVRSKRSSSSADPARCRPGGRGGADRPSAAGSPRRSAGRRPPRTGRSRR